MERQLAGESLSLARGLPLRDDVSTDEITPVPILTHYDDKLGRYPYTGFKAGEVAPDRRRVRCGKAASAVTVAGKRYGKGSSREHSPAAEKLAGIRLVIAESFERIYRQNADNIGLFTSTDFGLIARIEAGEAIQHRRTGRGPRRAGGGDPQAGGLLRFGQRHMRRTSGQRGRCRSRPCRARCSRRSSPATRWRPS